MEKEQNKHDKPKTDEKGRVINYDKSQTDQSFLKETNINNILKRYAKTGLLQAAILQNPTYGDFSDVPEYQEALNTITKAQHQFSLLDSKIRDRFKNDPSKLLEFMQDPKNKQEAQELGIIPKDPVQPVVDPIVKPS